MSDNLRNYTKAVYGFDHVYRLAPANAMSRKSPCADWRGSDLLAHALGGVKMVHSTATTGGMPKSYPKADADWNKLRDSTLAALDHPGVLASTVDSPFGPTTIDQLLGFMTAELLAHTWDLARTARVDDRLDPALCKSTLATWRSFPAEIARGPGVLGPAIRPAKGADAQTKLLNFVGRTG